MLARRDRKPAAHRGGGDDIDVAQVGADRIAADRCAPMPRLSMFYGITVWMYYDDHNPPHLHARYAGQWAQIGIEDGTVLAGNLPGRAQRLLREWIELHGDELAADWERARRDEPLHTIAPLP